MTNKVRLLLEVAMKIRRDNDDQPDDSIVVYAVPRRWHQRWTTLSVTGPDLKTRCQKQSKLYKVLKWLLEMLKYSFHLSIPGWRTDVRPPGYFWQSRWSRPCAALWRTPRGSRYFAIFLTWASTHALYGKVAVSQLCPSQTGTQSQDW